MPFDRQTLRLLTGKPYAVFQQRRLRVSGANPNITGNNTSRPNSDTVNRGISTCSIKYHSLFLLGFVPHPNLPGYRATDGASSFNDRWWDTTLPEFALKKNTFCRTYTINSLVTL